MANVRRDILSRIRLGWVGTRNRLIAVTRLRALRLVAIMLLTQRASYVVAAAMGSWARGPEHYVSPAANAALLGVAVAWNGWLAVVVWRRGWFARHLVWADVLMIVLLLFAVNQNLQPAWAISPANWAAKFAQATAATAGAVLVL